MGNAQMRDSSQSTNDGECLYLSGKQRLLCWLWVLIIPAVIAFLAFMHVVACFAVAHLCLAPLHQDDIISRSLPLAPNLLVILAVLHLGHVLLFAYLCGWFSSQYRVDAKGIEMDVPRGGRLSAEWDSLVEVSGSFVRPVSGSGFFAVVAWYATLGWCRPIVLRFRDGVTIEIGRGVPPAIAYSAFLGPIFQASGRSTQLLEVLEKDIEWAQRQERPSYGRLGAYLLVPAIVVLVLALFFVTVIEDVPVAIMLLAMAAGFLIAACLSLLHGRRAKKPSDPNG